MMLFAMIFIGNIYYIITYVYFQGESLISVSKSKLTQHPKLSLAGHRQEVIMIKEKVR